jgi:hypothetical protein
MSNFDFSLTKRKFDSTNNTDRLQRIKDDIKLTTFPSTLGSRHFAIRKS